MLGVWQINAPTGQMIEFKGSHFERKVIFWRIRWHVAYPISYRQRRKCRK